MVNGIMANGVLSQQMVWSIKVQIEILHKGQQQGGSLVQYTPPFAVTSSPLPFTICHLPFILPFAMFRQPFWNGLHQWHACYDDNEIIC